MQGGEVGRALAAEGAPAATTERGPHSQIVQPWTMFLRQLVLLVAPQRAHAEPPACRQGGLAGSSELAGGARRRRARPLGPKPTAAPRARLARVFAPQEQHIPNSLAFVSVEGRAVPIAVRVRVGDRLGVLQAPHGEYEPEGREES